MNRRMFSKILFNKKERVVLEFTLANFKKHLDNGKTPLKNDAEKNAKKATDSLLKTFQASKKGNKY